MTYSQSQEVKAYSVNFGQSLADDSVSFTISPATVTSGKITAIRVQDIARQIWYNWDDPGRTWNLTPSVVPGANNLYVGFWVTNTGAGAAGNITLTLKNVAGQTLATKTVSLGPSQSAGLEWTGDMPNANLILSAFADP